MDINIMAGVSLYYEKKYGIEITVKDLVWFSQGRTFTQFEEYLGLVYGNI